MGGRIHKKDNTFLARATLTHLTHCFTTDKLKTRRVKEFLSSLTHYLSNFNVELANTNLVRT